MAVGQVVPRETAYSTRHDTRAADYDRGWADGVSEAAGPRCHRWTQGGGRLSGPAAVWQRLHRALSLGARRLCRSLVVSMSLAFAGLGGVRSAASCESGRRAGRWRGWRTEVRVTGRPLVRWMGARVGRRSGGLVSRGTGWWGGLGGRESKCWSGPATVAQAASASVGARTAFHVERRAWQSVAQRCAREDEQVFELEGAR